MLPAQVFNSFIAKNYWFTGKTAFNVYFLPFVVSEMLFSKAHIMSPSMWWGFRMRADRWVILNWVSSSRKLLSPDSMVKGICLGRCSSRRPACTGTNDKCWTEIMFLSHGVWLAFCKTGLHRKAFYTSVSPFLRSNARYTTVKVTNSTVWHCVYSIHMTTDIGNGYQNSTDGMWNKFLKSSISEPSLHKTSHLCTAF